MSTIPTTSKRLRVPYTVVGGRHGDRQTRVPGLLSALLLNRGGGLYKHAQLSELSKLGFDEIVSVEVPPASPNIETLSRSFPSVRFLVLHDDTTRGEQINIGMEEANGAFVLVVWNDMKIAPSNISRRLEDRLRDQGAACIVPLLQNQKLESVPSVMAPAFFRKTLKVLALQPTADAMMSLYPFDYCGIYHKERFILLGGYDHTLSNMYWQKMDFGFRSYMWGEKIVCSTSLRISYLDDVPEEITTPDESYQSFFLKNLSIRRNTDYGVLPYSAFIPFWTKAGGFAASLSRFREVRRWVSINKYRFRQDARSVTELWEVPET
jgi:hypothetical protein